MLISLRFNARRGPNEQITFQEMYMHNADGDMETLLDMFNPGDREVFPERWIERSG